MGMFDDLIEQYGSGNAPAPVGAPASKPGGMFDDLIQQYQGQPAPDRAPVSPPPAPANTPWNASRYAEDYGKSVGTGASRAVAGTVGMIPDMANLIATGADMVRSKVTGRPYDEVRAEANARAYVPTDKLVDYGGDALNKAYGYEYEPQSRVGKFLKTGTEFAGQAALMPTQAMRSGVAGLAKGIAAYGLVPGVASEAAGQLTEGSALEPWARVGAGLGGAVTGAKFLAPRTVDQALLERSGVAGMTKAEKAEALQRFDDVTRTAQSYDQAVPLSNFNAFDYATQGRSGLSDMQRHVEATGRMKDYYARTPQAVDAAARSEFDRIAPLNYNPDDIGPQIGAAARTAVEQSPEGRAFTQARRDAGPDVTPLQAGEVIQPDQRQIYNERYQARADASGPLYRAADAAPERVGVDRMLPVERPGEPTIERPQYSQPQFLPDAPKPLDPKPARGSGVAQESGQPLSLGQFIARNGGLAPEGDVLATDLHKFNVPGYGSVVRPTGKGIDDFWRERLIEEGYFRPDADGGMARDISSDLLRKLQNEQRGAPPIYPAGTSRGMAPAGSTYGQLSDEYANAKSLAESRMRQDLSQVGVDPDKLHPAIQDRVIGALARGEHDNGADALEAVTASMRPSPEPIARPTTVQEEMYAPRFGQVNPQSVVDHIDRLLPNATGKIYDALVDARKTMFDPATGETTLSIPRLHGARQALNAQIEDAPKAVQSALLDVRNRLDAALSVAPEYEAARATHEAYSRPLDVFEKNRPLGQIVGQDQKTSAFNLAPERVPGVIDQGPSAARDLVGTNSPASRMAYEGHLRTRLLDEATVAGNDISADRLRSLIRRERDQLDQFPDVRRQLESIATAREGRVAVEQSPVGRLARNDLRTKQAVEALFPANPNANSEQEIARAVGQLSTVNPWASRQLVRLHWENTFNEAVQKNLPGPNQMGGPKFAAVLAGNPQQAKNLMEGLRALPHGETIAQGMVRFLNVLEAMGKRQAIGSRTAYNAEDLKGLSVGKKAEVLAKMAGGNVLALPKKITEALERWRLGRNLDQLGRLASDPNAIPAFRGLLNAEAKGGDIRGPVSRLVAIASSGVRDTAPLRLTVQPNAQAQ